MDILLHPDELLMQLGSYAFIGALIIVFIECGLLVGFFLPGDSLLFVTGLFVAKGYIGTPIYWVVIALIVAAIMGNVVGYWVGNSVGSRLFQKPDSRLFKKQYVDQASDFFERYGAKAIILARFVPIVRTFITAIAGVSRMDYRKFVTFSAVGAVLWAGGITLIGYFLGNIPFIHDNLEIMILAVVFVSVLPIVFEYWRARKERKAGVSQRERQPVPEGE